MCVCVCVCLDACVMDTELTARTHTKVVYPIPRARELFAASGPTGGRRQRLCQILSPAGQDAEGAEGGAREGSMPDAVGRFISRSVRSAKGWLAAGFFVLRFPFYHTIGLHWFIFSFVRDLIDWV